MKKFTTLLLILIMTFSAIPLQAEAGKDKAEVLYISVEDFAHELVNQMGMQATVDNEASRYINCLMDIGVIKEGDIADDKADLKRGDMLVLLSRADDYINSPKIEEDLVQEVIEKRISDIEKVVKAKKEDLAKGYIKGFLKGYSNGSYSPDRELKVNNKIVKTDAINCIKMLTNKSLRAKISPDGQLIRTTNLPNNAYMFQYILASFPNRYYEAKLRFEGVTQRINGKLVPMKSPEDYTYPVNVAKAKLSGITDFNEVKEKYLDLWMDKVYTRVWNTFNVNYKTIDDIWVETMAQTDSYIINSSKKLYTLLNMYVKEMKDNKTIVECNKVVMDKSSMYYYNGMYYVRCYVHYRIVSTRTKNSYSAEELCNYENYWGPYNCVLFSRSSNIDIRNYKNNKWVDGVFDIGICGSDTSSFGVSHCDWSPILFNSIER